MAGGVAVFPHVFDARHIPVLLLLCRSGPMAHTHSHTRVVMVWVFPAKNQEIQRMKWVRAHIYQNIIKQNPSLQLKHQHVYPIFKELECIHRCVPVSGGPCTSDGLVEHGHHCAALRLVQRGEGAQHGVCDDQFCGSHASSATHRVSPQSCSLPTAREGCVLSRKYIGNTNVSILARALNSAAVIGAMTCRGTSGWRK